MLPGSRVPRIQPRGTDVRSRRDALASTLDYISSAPVECCQAALYGLGHQTGGPDGTCILYNAQGADTSRIKIPKKATATGRPVPIGGVAEVLFDEYNINQKSDIIQVVLFVHRRDLFDRLHQWAKKEIDPNNAETWVVSHTCHQGHLRCGNPAHLFLATNSVNQRQRQCPAASSQPCPQCYLVPTCTCNQLANRAMADGSTLPCVIPLAVGISPVQQQLDNVQQQLDSAQLQLANAQQTITQLQQSNAQLQQQFHVQGNLVEALRRRTAHLDAGTASPSSPAKRKLT